MQISHATLTKGAALTLVSFSVGNLIRLATSIILARLLAPELFGIMVLVFTLRTGVELLTDVGIGQNIIYNKNAEDPDFYNTAWTLRAIRGVLLWLLTCAAALPMAHFYEKPILATIIPVASLAIVLTGFSSLNAFLLQKRLQLANLTLYDAIFSTVSAIGQIVLAYFIPTIWGLVYGLLFAGTVALTWSYFVLPSVKYRFRLSKDYAREILHFGKWISLTSIVYFLSISFDRFYLAGVVPLALLGVYGISRSIADLTSGFALQLSNSVIFPFIARHSEVPRAELRNEVTSIRHTLLLIAALGFSVAAAFVDLAIHIVFDQRYHAAGWMAPLLIIGGWFSILCSLNESTLLGLGAPRYGAIAYSVKFLWLLVGLPLGINKFGPVGGIIAIAVSDIFRYPAVFFGQIQQRFAFGWQDLFATLLMFVLFAIFEWLRWMLGLGTPFDSVFS